MSEPDLSEFEELSQPKRPPCRIGVALTELDESDALKAALAASPGDITHSAISQWLERRGVEAHYNIVASHRKGSCNCDG